MEIFPNWTAIPVIVFLLIFILISKRIFFAPLQRVLEERHKRIEGARQEAEEIRAASQNRLSDVDRKMREARRESDAQMAQLKNQALGEKSKIVGAKKSEAEALVSEARRDIRSKAEAARETLLAQSQEFAKQIASQILKRPVSGKRA